MGLFDKFKKKKEREIIRNFLMNYELYPLSYEYREAHKPQIQVLNWLLSYYDGRTAATPKEYLESEMKLLMQEIFIEKRTDRINARYSMIFLLYHWINYKYIIGFTDNRLLDNFQVNIKNNNDYTKLVDYFNFVKPYIHL